MGLDLFTSLAFTLVDVGGAAILVVTSTWQQLRPTLFNGLGCLTSFMHQPLINPAITPAIQPLLRISLGRRDGVATELQRLLGTSIIEPVTLCPGFQT